MKYRDMTDKGKEVIMRFLPFYLFTLLLFSAQPANAQFFKKLFKKKKPKTEKLKEATKTDGIDDALQLPLADITTADNQHNRNAFLGIPIGIKAERFAKLLLEKGFTEEKHEGPQTARSYIFMGDVYGAPSKVTLIVSEQTARTYAVDVEDQNIYATEQEVIKRFKDVKAQLVKEYGAGYVDNQGEAYCIQSRLGTVTLHYERGQMMNNYQLGIAFDDAKAYKMAYGEMEDKTYETLPRTVENGLAAACNHTDIVGLAVSVLQARTQAKATAILKSYEYTVGKVTPKLLPATFVMGNYQVKVAAMLRRRNVTSLVITATDDLEAVRRDLQTNGFTTTDQNTWQQGKTKCVLSADKQGRVVMSVKSY